MEKTKDTQVYRDSLTFEKDIERICRKTIEEKLQPFLEYCIQTHNAEPIMKVIYELSVNTFTANNN